MASLRKKLHAARAVALVVKMSPQAYERVRDRLGAVYPYVVDPAGDVFQHKRGKLEKLRAHCPQIRA